MILGIDPGMTGAMALVRDDELLGVWDMPITQKTIGKGKEVNAYLLADLLREIHADHGFYRVELEAVSAMPGQGVTSMFSFGRSRGVIEGVVAGIGVSVSFATPQRWKRFHGLIKKEKDAARNLVIQQFPDSVSYFQRKKDIGRADATCIALYGASR